MVDNIIITFVFTDLIDNFQGYWNKYLIYTKIPQIKGFTDQMQHMT